MSFKWFENEEKDLSSPRLQLPWSTVFDVIFVYSCPFKDFSFSGVRVYVIKLNPPPHQRFSHVGWEICKQSCSSTIRFCTTLLCLLSGPLWLYGLQFTLGVALLFTFSACYCCLNPSLFRAVRYQFICLNEIYPKTKQKVMASEEWQLKLSSSIHIYVLKCTQTCATLTLMGSPKARCWVGRWVMRKKTRGIAETSRSHISPCQARLVGSRAPNPVFTGEMAQHGLLRGPGSQALPSLFLDKDKALKVLGQSGSPQVPIFIF